MSALHDGESASITGLPDSSVCTFYGSYEAESGETKSLDPIQCIMGQNISESIFFLLYMYVA